MTAKQIDAYLHQYFLDGYKYQISNSYIFDWECDFFAIANSGYSYEVEVKVSRGDFFADFNKVDKHRILSFAGNTLTKRKFVCSEKEAKQDMEIIKSGNWSYPPRSHVEFIPVENVRPNKFVFAVPEGLVSESEVPDYAGLMYICPRKGRRIYSQACKYIKQPPALHKKKPDFTRRLLKKLYWYYRNNRELPKTKSQVGIEQQQKFSELES